MIKCVVKADRLSVVCGKGSIVYIDNKAYEQVKKFVEPVVEKAVPEKTVEKAVKKSRKK